MRRRPTFVALLAAVAAVTIALAAPAGAVGTSTNSLAFGNQTVGTTSAPQTFTFTPTFFQGVTNIATTDPEFAFTANLGSCSNNNACPVTVTFTPTSPGVKNAAILLVLNGVNAGTTQSIALTGTGVAAPPPALPEAAWAIGLPVAGVVLLFGAALLIARRRRARATA